MAFLNRLGNILKQNVSNHVSSQFRAPTASLFQAVRSMSTSSSKLFVGGLSYSTDEMSLKEAFAQYGEVVEARVIMDRETGRSRGFGFVTFTSTEEAATAIQALDGQDLHGRAVRVNYATEKPRAGGFGGGYGGAGGGGYGGGYGGADGGGYGGGYGGARGGGYGGGYGGQGGSYGGGGGYQGGNYQGGGGGYGSGNQYQSGGVGGYGGADSVQGGGSNFSGGQGASSGFDNFASGGVGGSEEPLGGYQEDGAKSGNESGEDDKSEPNDYANNRS